MSDVKAHPAKFSPSILAMLTKVLIEAFPEEHADSHGVFRILDPFAGVGGIHQLAHKSVQTVGVELEPEWASAHPDTIVGDATALPFEAGTFDAVVTSPCYGNRMADRYDGRDGSKRYTYRIYLGRMPTDGSAAVMKWGQAYRELHEKAWVEALRVVRPGGLIVVNMKNHFKQVKRKGVKSEELQKVTEWHLRTLMELGCTVERIIPVDTPSLKHGKGSELRDIERILVMRRP